MMRRRAALVLLLVLAMGSAAHARTPYLARTEVQQFIDELVGAHGFERARLEHSLKQARYSASVERLMQPAIPFGQRNWLEYRDRYVEPARIAAGVSFWRANADAMARAEQQFGVPAEVIVAIIGIETYFGRITGNFRTLDVFATLAFDYLRRADFYRAEFVEFLLLARDQNADPASYRGSFAGAIGLPQFMPGSIRRWAVDFDGDGRIDLLGSPVDAIGSVARYLVGPWLAARSADRLRGRRRRSDRRCARSRYRSAHHLVGRTGRGRGRRPAAAARHPGAADRPATRGARRTARPCLSDRHRRTSPRS